MLILILFLIVGSFLVYISKFNFMPVSINLGAFIIADIPLFYVIVGSFLFGLVLSYLVYLIKSISTSLTLLSKDHQIKKEQQEKLELAKRVSQLESEIDQPKPGLIV